MGLFRFWRRLLKPLARLVVAVVEMLAGLCASTCRISGTDPEKCAEYCNRWADGVRILGYGADDWDAALAGVALAAAMSVGFEYLHAGFDEFKRVLKEYVAGASEIMRRCEDFDVVHVAYDVCDYASYILNLTDEERDNCAEAIEKYGYHIVRLAKNEEALVACTKARA